MLYFPHPKRRSIRMYIIKNAFFNIFRNKGRNLLVALILLIMMVSSMISLVIYSSATKQIHAFQEQLGAEVTITRNDEKLEASLASFQEPTLTQLLAFSKSNKLSSARVQGSAVSHFVNVKAVKEGNDVNGGMITQEGNPYGNAGYVRTNGILIATNYKKISDEFIHGTRKIIEGQAPASSKEVLISKELAELNHLKPGAAFEVKPSTMGLQGAIESKPMKFVISGIFEDHTLEDPTQMQIATYNRRNEVFTLLDEQLVSSNENAFTVEGSFTMKNPDEIKALNEELHQTGIGEYYEIRVNTNAYQRIIAPYQSMKKMTLLFTIGMIVTGGIILIILSFLSLRERKYEIGVLRAMGMKKHLIIKQMILEMMMLSVCCLIAGYLCAQPIMKPIAQNMLEAQVEKASNQVDPLTLSVGGNSSGVEIKESQLDISFHADTMMEITIIALLLAFISSGTAVWMIVRFEPMQILSERN